MFCKKCGKQLQEDAKFCLNCGEKIISSSPVINESFKQKPEKESKNDTQKNSGARLGIVIGILAVLVIVVVFVFFGKGNNLPNSCLVYFHLHGCVYFLALTIQVVAQCLVLTEYKKYHYNYK